MLHVIWNLLGFVPVTSGVVEMDTAFSVATAEATSVYLLRVTVASGPMKSHWSASQWNNFLPDW